MNTRLKGSDLVAQEIQCFAIDVNRVLCEAYDMYYTKLHAVHPDLSHQDFVSTFSSLLTSKVNSLFSKMRASYAEFYSPF